MKNSDTHFCGVAFALYFAQSAKVGDMMDGEKKSKYVKFYTLASLAKEF